MSVCKVDDLASWQTARLQTSKVSRDQRHGVIPAANISAAEWNFIAVAKVQICSSDWADAVQVGDVQSGRWTTTEPMTCSFSMRKMRNEFCANQNLLGGALFEDVHLKPFLKARRTFDALPHTSTKTRLSI